MQETTLFQEVKEDRAGKENLPDKQSKDVAEALSDYYRKNVFNEEVLGMLQEEDFCNLIKVAEKADLGSWTAIRAAFCLGHQAREMQIKEVVDSHKEVKDSFDRYLNAIEKHMFEHAFQCGHEAALNQIKKSGVDA